MPAAVPGDIGARSHEPALPSAIIFARASAAYTIPIMNATNAHTDIKRKCSIASFRDGAVDLAKC